MIKLKKEDDIYKEELKAIPDKVYYPSVEEMFRLHFLFKEYNPDKHGYVIVLTDTDTPQAFKEYFTELEPEEIPWESVSDNKGCLIATVFTNNEFGLTYIIDREHEGELKSLVKLWDEMSVQ